METAPDNSAVIPLKSVALLDPVTLKLPITFVDFNCAKLSPLLLHFN